MHVPDGFLNAPTALAAGALSACAVAVAARRAKRVLPPRKVPLMGLAAAFVFAAQMINFPVAGGTSGHLVGGTLCAVLLGPSAAVLVIASVLIVQCLAFADGGLLALGANIFNMAVIGAVGGYAIFALLSRGLGNSARARLVGVAVASWCATVAASVACAGELAASHVVSWPLAFPAMASVHMLIGVGEAIITVLVVYGVTQSRPELLATEADAPRGGGFEVVVFGLIIALGIAIFVSPFASSWPDGLDHVAGHLGFAARAKQTISAPIPEYAFPWVPSAAATSIAGAVGVLIVFGIGLAMARALVPHREPASDA